MFVFVLRNLLIVVLVVAVVGEGLWIWKEKEKIATLSSQVASSSKMPPAGPNAKGSGRAPIILSKGTNLKTSPIFQYAFQVAPGTLSDAAKKALIGWTIASKTQIDGSIVVTLTPKDSDDQNQQYTVKSGNVLYFIEQTPSDDKDDSDTDLNYRDDYGIVTDANGVIQ